MRSKFKRYRDKKRPTNYFLTDLVIIGSPLPLFFTDKILVKKEFTKKVVLNKVFGPKVPKKLDPKGLKIGKHEL